MQLSFFSNDDVMLALGGLVIAGALAWGLRNHYKNKPTAAELERRRRAMLNAYGKMGDAQLNEIQGSTAIYSYHVRGVEYIASQDCDAPGIAIPEAPWTMIGPASVKYDPRNPANSIIISEKWSGIRTSARLSK